MINLILVGGVAAISTSAVLIRLAQAQPAVIAFYRLLFATLLLAPWAVKQSRQVKLANRDFFCRFGGGGTFLAFHFFVLDDVFRADFGCFFRCFSHYSAFMGILAVRAVSQGKAHESHVGGFGPGSRRLYGGGFHSGGRRAIAPGGKSSGGGGGAIMMACYFLVGRRLRRRLPPLALYSALVYGSSSIVLALFILARGIRPWGGYEPTTWLIFASLAFIPTILGHNSLNWALKYLPATMVSVVILGEPLGAGLLAALILHEIPAGLEILGSLLTLGGIFWSGGGVIRPGKGLS